MRNATIRRGSSTVDIDASGFHATVLEIAAPSRTRHDREASALRDRDDSCTVEIGMNGFREVRA